MLHAFVDPKRRRIEFASIDEKLPYQVDDDDCCAMRITDVLGRSCAWVLTRSAATARTTRRVGFHHDQVEDPESSAST